MNKKIIAIAIATAMAAPVAMADVKVSGQIGAALVQASKGFTVPTSSGLGASATDTTKSYRAMQDSGLSKVNFSGKDGDVSFMIGLDVRSVMGGSSASIAGRDFWIGHKLGAGTFSFGRMGSALAGIEGDKYNATFLEMRRTAAVASPENTNSDSFTKGPVLQYAMKAGGAAIKVQYDANDNTAASTSEGYYAVSVKGQAGNVGYFAGVNNGAGTEGTPANKESTTKIGASMKFGAAKVTAMMMASDDNTAIDSSSTAIFADFGVGSGTSVGVGYGMQTKGAANKDTWMRLAVTKKLSKSSSLFGGYVAKHDDSATTNKDTNGMGIGMKVKF